MGLLVHQHGYDTTTNVTGTGLSWPKRSLAFLYISLRPILTTFIYLE